MAQLRIAIALLLALASANQSPTDVLSSTDKTRIQKRFQTILSNGGSVGDMHYAVKGLAILGVEIENTQKLCKTIKNEAEHRLDAVYHANMATTTLGCAKAPSPAMASMLQKALNGDNLINMLYASEIAFGLSQDDKLDLNELDFTSLVRSVLRLMKDDGTCTGKQGSKKSSKQNAGIAFQILGNVYAKVETLDETLRALIVSASAKVGALVGLGKQKHGMTEFVDRVGTSLVSSSVVIKGLDVFARATETNLDIDKDVVNGLATFFVRNKYVLNAKSGYFLVSALDVLADNVIHVPLVLRVVNAESLVLGSEGDDALLRVKLSNVMDEFVTKASIKLKKAQSGTRQKKVIINKDLVFTPLNDEPENRVYQADFLKDVPEESWGIYSCSFSIKPENGSPDTLVKFKVKIADQIDNVDFEVFPYARTQGPQSVSDGDKIKVTYPKSSDDVVTLSASQHVQMSFTLRATKTPLETLIRITNTVSGRTHFFVPTKLSSLYRLKMVLNSDDFADIEEGTYRVSVLVGDVLSVNSVEWDTAKLFVDFGDEELDSDEPSREAAYSKKAQIFHTFHEPEAQPSVVISRLFGIVVLLPLVFLVKTLNQIGAFSFQFPERQKKLHALLFQASMFVLIVFFVCYWGFFNIFEAGQGLLLISIVLVVVGYYSLKEHALMRLGKQKTE